MNGRRKVPVEYTCKLCGKLFLQYRKDNVTCSPTCSQRNWTKNNPVKAHNRYSGANARARIKRWRENNPDKFRQTQRRHKNKRLKIDLLYKLNHCAGTMIRSSLRRLSVRKSSRTTEILGCSLDEFRMYIESKFDSWMNWDNYGIYDGELNHGWDLDHIVPISTAKTEQDVIKLNHYSNLQPLCSVVNRHHKRNRLDFL